jgi:hypothetical protein
MNSSATYVDNYLNSHVTSRITGTAPNILAHSTRNNTTENNMSGSLVEVYCCSSET